MARKGDILSKPVATRIPMEVYLRLQLMAFQRKQTMSAFLCDYLCNEDRPSGEVEIQEKIVYRNEPELEKEIKFLRENSMKLSQHIIQLSNISEVAHFHKKNGVGDDFFLITNTDDLKQALLNARKRGQNKNN